MYFLVHMFVIIIEFYRILQYATDGEYTLFSMEEFGSIKCSGYIVQASKLSLLSTPLYIKKYIF